MATILENSQLIYIVLKKYKLTCKILKMSSFFMEIYFFTILDKIRLVLICVSLKNKWKLPHAIT
jgi:hypothetical protein